MRLSVGPSGDRAPSEWTDAFLACQTPTPTAAYRTTWTGETRSSISHSRGSPGAGRADDDVGRVFAEALARRARDRVHVRLLYDWFGIFGLAMLAVAVLVALVPTLVVLPLVVLLGWGGLSLLLRAWRLGRGRSL